MLPAEKCVANAEGTRMDYQCIFTSIQCIFTSVSAWILMRDFWLSLKTFSVSIVIYKFKRLFYLGCNSDIYNDIL